jgi:hypothetical protein
MMKRVMLTRPVRPVTSYVRASSNSSKPAINCGVKQGSKAATSKVKQDPKMASRKPPYIPPLKGGIVYKGSLAGVVEKKENRATLEEAVNLASQLTPSERKQLLAKLALTAGALDIEQSRDVDMWSVAVQTGLQAAHGGGDSPALGPALVKRTVGSSQAWGPVDSFMRNNGLDKLQVSHRQGVYMLLAKLVIERAQDVASYTNQPLSAKLVGTCSANIAGVFDKAFPGYIAAGLVPLVAKQLVSAK